MRKNLVYSKDKAESALSFLACVLMGLLLVIAVARLAFSLCYIKVYVVGSSMSNTLSGAPARDSEGGEYVYAFKSDTPRRGDIVIVETEKKTLIKRVVALGGDTVELKEGVLYLNGKIKDEPYVSAENNTPSRNNFAQIKVPDGCMFCLGDNRDVSIDSRSEEYGCMPVEWTAGIVADWSMTCKGAITAFNTFFDFTLPNAFGR